MKKKIFAICGSTRQHSSNLSLLKVIARRMPAYDFTIYEQLSELPHFNPDLDTATPPEAVHLFRTAVKEADGVIICTPEYVFSLPGSLKNALEWTVSTSTFSGKPTAIITASSLGEKAHEALQLIMKTIEARMTEQMQLHISGVRARLNANEEITDVHTSSQLKMLITSLSEMIHKNSAA